MLIYFSKTVNMKNFYQSLLIIFITGLFFTSCNSIKVYSDFDSEADFSNYKSFAFYKNGIDKVEISDLDKKRILRSIEKNLTSRGMKIMNDPDLLINISTKSSDNIYIDNTIYSPFTMGWYPYYGRNYTRLAHTRSQGILYIDIIDSNSKQLIWQGKGVGFLSSSKMNRDELLDEYVNKILSVFPPENSSNTN